jgi:hypothetical protein
VAHFEVEYDATTKEYKSVDLPSLRSVYQTIEEAVPIITGSVAHLASLFKRLDIGTERSDAIAKQNAYAFWGISNL